MPLNPTVLANDIHALLTTTPIGQSPVSTVSTASNSDGTSTTTVTGAMKDVLMPDPMAQVIADAVAKAVVSHLLSMALVTGVCPPGTAGGPLTLGKIT
ncbi:hypothetical protein UFOVP276_70 [uncultured Caudovirales phage]|uniref:Uncharacterized protein n=1 Tax=uncultured Caudovirales phage TaxID=2100421 RepID=A0A6J5LF07_9CAUD|nr:hypothetical protein UFOVP127_207 [uncultured Caudovirales phage]CAB4135098.1 hypothetical protein UFOVP276_70 [uncultured Caudovirales phage]